MSRPARRSLAVVLLAIAAGFAVAGAIVPVAAADPAKPAPAAKDGWPDTPAGAAARRWVAAFSKGEEAMRACLTEILAPASLATRGLEERMTTYRENREKFGTLTLATIEKSAPDEVEATLLAADLTRHRFVFKVEPDEPHRLVSVGRIETISVPGHGGFHH
ncbi:MAG TPA: hypothetical protein VMQ62_10545 [Dongiaceae bacterium]|nr:hypothetical protein [Dongiaceae bacterium]